MTAAEIHEEAQLKHTDRGIQKMFAVTEKSSTEVFRIAYYILKENRSFYSYEEL
jgi:hypothetical protein